MKKVTVNLYQFNELSEEAKAKAINFFREDEHIFDFASECLIDNLKETALILGIGIDNFYYSGFCSQGDGACFAGSYGYQKESVKNIKEHFPEDEELQEITTGLYELQRRNFYRLSCTVEHRGHYYHSGCTIFEHESFSSMETDEKLEELLRDYMNYCYKRLEVEFDYVISEEAIIETINANNYDFTVDGSIY